MGSLRSKTLLSAANLTKRFGAVTAVRGVNLEVSTGDFLCIFGPNGAGKTTLLRLIASLARATSGGVEFDFQGSGSLREQIGYVSHQSLLYNELTGVENLVFFARLYGLQCPQDRALELLGKLGLRPARHQFVKNYSSGMRQRLTLARALLHEPRLLLLDEPYAGLDQHGTRLLTGLLQRLKEEERTVLLITHNLLEGLALSSRVLIMNRGEIVFGAARSEIDEHDFENLYFRLVEK